MSYPKRAVRFALAAILLCCNSGFSQEQDDDTKALLQVVASQGRVPRADEFFGFATALLALRH